MLSFKKILIANRGEIATRIVKAAQGLGIIAVVIFAEDDKNSLHVSLADEAISLGDGTITETYLNIPKIIQIAVSARCAAIHPGYGFLSENYLFAKACEDHHLVFIGPSAFTIKQMGDKIEAKNIVRELGIPVLESTECTAEELKDKHDLKFPLIIKPALGGGGKGMYIANHNNELEEKVNAASREANNYFANKRIYLEQYIEFARHIEVQILGDNFGNIVHLFDRECTIQRNFQKMIEEAPSPSLDEDLRGKLTSAAVRIASAVKYMNAGTIEFLLDNKGNWYFIEMNTRIQVEHPVTEAITDVDLVKIQIRIAEGAPIPFNQNDIIINGHAIEFRINAEDPVHHFRPSSGSISLFAYPEFCRVDTFIKSPYELTSHYDSLLGKIVVHSRSRKEAISHAIECLRNSHIHGIETNISYLAAILSSDDFSKNQISTRFSNDFLPSFVNERQSFKANQTLYIPVIAFSYLNFQRPSSSSISVWNKIGYWRTVQEIKVKYHAEVFEVSFRKSELTWFYRISGIDYEVKIVDKNKDFITIYKDGFASRVYFSSTLEGKTCMELDGFQFIMESPDLLRTASLYKKNIESLNSASNGYIRSHLHGRVTKINVLENTKINRGDVLLVIESMKTENHIVAPMSGFIKTIHVSEGIQVKDNMLLIELEYLKV